MGKIGKRIKELEVELEPEEQKVFVPETTEPAEEPEKVEVTP